MAMQLTLVSFHLASSLLLSVPYVSSLRASPLLAKPRPKVPGPSIDSVAAMNQTGSRARSAAARRSSTCGCLRSRAAAGKRLRSRRSPRTPRRTRCSSSRKNLPPANPSMLMLSNHLISDRRILLIERSCQRSTLRVGGRCYFENLGTPLGPTTVDV